AGESENDQLACILELLGMPPQKLISDSKKGNKFFNCNGYPRYCHTKVLPNGTVQIEGSRNSRGKMRGPPGSKDWSMALNGCDDQCFIDFMKRCLDWDPLTRMTPHDAMRHPWIIRRATDKSGQLPP